MTGRESRSFGIAVIALAACLALGASPSPAAEEMCVEIVGVDQGAIAGDSLQAGCDDLITGVEFHHLVDSQQTKLRGRDVIFTKPTDRATVNLWTALDNGEELSTVRFLFFRLDPDSGAIVHYRTVTLERAFIEAIEPYMADVDDPELASLRVRERIRLSYDGLTIRFELDGEQTNIRF